MTPEKRASVIKRMMDVNSSIIAELEILNERHILLFDLKDYIVENTWSEEAEEALEFLENRSLHNIN